MKNIKVAIDCDVSRRWVSVLTSAYGDRGYEFVYVRDLVPAKHEDEHWANVFVRIGGTATISGDSAIAKKPHKQVAFIDNGLACFFLQPPWSAAPGRVKLAHLVYWWPAIEEKITQDARGQCWQVPFEFRSQVLRLRPRNLKHLRVPDDVLTRARQAREKPQ